MVLVVWGVWGEPPIIRWRGHPVRERKILWGASGVGGTRMVWRMLLLRGELVETTLLGVPQSTLVHVGLRGTGVMLVRGSVHVGGSLRLGEVLGGVEVFLLPPHL